MTRSYRTSRAGSGRLAGRSRVRDTLRRRPRTRTGRPVFMGDGRLLRPSAVIFHSGWHTDGENPKPDSNRRIHVLRTCPLPLGHSGLACPRLGSNQRPPGSEPGALSAELRGQGCAFGGPWWAGVRATGFEPAQRCDRVTAGPDSPTSARPLGVTGWSRTGDIQRCIRSGGRIRTFTCTH